MNDTFTLIVCSECGTGNYRRSVTTGNVACDHCGHAVYSGDIDLEAGETFAWSARRLGYVTTDLVECGCANSGPVLTAGGVCDLHSNHG